MNAQILLLQRLTNRLRIVVKSSAGLSTATL
jgi:hypothetical protein